MRVRRMSMQRTAGMNAYLRSPCPITCHPLAVESVLAVRIVVDPSRDKIPPPLKGRVAEENLDAFQRIVVK
jgi:hypothetical protein